MNVINGNEKVRAETQKMTNLLFEELAQKKAAKYTESATNTETDHGAASNEEGPRRTNRLPFSIDSILADKAQESEARQEVLPPWAEVLFASHQAAQRQTPVIGASSAALGSMGTGFSSPSGFSNSELLDSGTNSFATASAPILKRAAPWEHKPDETLFGTSTKKFAQSAAKSPEMAIPTQGTSTVWTSDQFNLLLQLCQQSPGLAVGLLNSIPQVKGTPIGSLEAFQASNQNFVDSVMGHTGGQTVNNGTLAASGTTPGFGLPQLQEMGLFGNISSGAMPSTTQQSSSSFGEPQANTTDTDNDAEKP